MAASHLGPACKVYKLLLQSVGREKETPLLVTGGVEVWYKNMCHWKGQKAAKGKGLFLRRCATAAGAILGWQSSPESHAGLALGETGGCSFGLSASMISKVTN